MLYEVITMLMILLSLFAELLVSNRALVVCYNGNYYFPTYGQIIPGRTFGLDYDYETSYRDLQKKFRSEGGENRVILPLVPYNAFENDLREGEYPPFPPSLEDRHFMGTDVIGRDILARLVYGFRNNFV